MGAYDISVRFHFDGTFRVKANSREAAIRKVAESCEMSMKAVHDGGNKDILDWNFPMWADKKIYKRKKKF